jgi:hypothetical protein
MELVSTKFQYKILRKKWKKLKRVSPAIASAASSHAPSCRRCRCRIQVAGTKENLVGKKHSAFVLMTDRSGVKQPVGQKFLTNVAVVRYRVKGQEYQATHSRASSVARRQMSHVLCVQVACYKNKLSSWRSGIETDFDEVLQVRTSASAASFP